MFFSYWHFQRAFSEYTWKTICDLDINFKVNGKVFSLIIWIPLMQNNATTYALIFLILLYIACEQLKYSNLFDVAHGLCQKLLQNTKRYWGQKIAQLHTDHQSHSLSSTVVVSYKYWNRNMKPLFRLLKHNVLKDNNAELTQIHYYEQFRANVKENFSVESVISKECKTSTKYFLQVWMAYSFPRFAI